uniref:Uncharacterized protein n=1 Tax=Oryza sativa subsp. japonica TaxID=39947 RepID=Q69MQ3_ORYSJ|nr:hypothetical protein [Oryza sativa Japonica Group]
MAMHQAATAVKQATGGGGAGRGETAERQRHMIMDDGTSRRGGWVNVAEASLSQRDKLTGTCGAVEALSVSCHRHLLDEKLYTNTRHKRGSDGSTIQVLWISGSALDGVCTRDCGRQPA